MLRLVLLLCTLFVAIARGLDGSKSCEQLPSDHSFEAGFSLQLILPSRLPDFDTSVAGYGPRVGVLVPGGVLEAELLYGYQERVSLVLGEMNYRIFIDTPFFSSFLLGGTSFFHYRLGDENHDKVGLQLGYGFLIPATVGCQILLNMKIYFQRRPVVAFGGGFLFLI